jgi:uncharacterized repeat protein (TIGR02543 family)
MTGHRRTLKETAHVALQFTVAVACMTSVLSLGLDVAAHAASASTISEAATFPVSAEVLGGTTLSVNPQNVGDLVIFESQIHSHSVTITSVTCPETATWQLAQRYVDTVNGVITEEIWWAVATSTGPTKISATYSGSVATLRPELVSDSLTSASPSVWSFGSGGGAAAASTTAIAFPSVTSGAAANQMFWGYAASTATAVPGSTPGFTYSTTAEGNLIASNDALSPNSVYAPTASETPASNNTSIAAIFAATPTANQYTVTFNGNGATGGSMANEVASSPTALSANAFTRTGYTFTGWNTVANGTGTAYANGATYPFTASATLYAQWSSSTGTITKIQSGDAGTSAIASGAAMTVLPANATLGDSVVVAVLGAGSTGQTVTSVTSPMGTFTKVTGNLQSGQSDIELWICSNVTTAARTLTVTWSGAGSGFAQATEFSGSLSAVASTPTQGTGTSPTGSVTTTAPGDVALVYVNGQSITAAPSSPWSNYDAGAFVYSWGESVATQIVAAPSTVNASWTLASSVKWQTIGLSLAGT